MDLSQRSRKPNISRRPGYGWKGSLGRCSSYNANLLTLGSWSNSLKSNSDYKMPSPGSHFFSNFFSADFYLSHCLGPVTMCITVMSQILHS